MKYRQALTGSQSRPAPGIFLCGDLSFSEGQTTCPLLDYKSGMTSARRIPGRRPVDLAGAMILLW